MRASRKKTTAKDRERRRHPPYLRISHSGSKLWIQRVYIHGKRYDLDLASVKLVSLAEVRAVAFENRRLARARSGPLAEKHKTRLPAMPTFREAAVALSRTSRDACPLICATIFWLGPKMPKEQPLRDPVRERLGRMSATMTVTGTLRPRIEACPVFLRSSTSIIWDERKALKQLRERTRTGSWGLPGEAAHAHCSNADNPCYLRRLRRPFP